MFYLSARNIETKGTEMSHYRGFSITFSDVNNAFNARPTAETKQAHPRLYPIAARTMDELTPCLDMMIEMHATKTVACTIPCDGTGWTGNPRERCLTHYVL